jgi:hypothetical protein
MVCVNAFPVWDSYRALMSHLGLFGMIIARWTALPRSLISAAMKVTAQVSHRIRLD